MGAFEGPDGNVMLVRNHEVNNPGPAFGDASQAYDPMAQSGYDDDRGHPARRGRARLHQPQRHADELLRRPACRGAAWITCEETVNGPDVGPDFTGVSNIPLTKPHGFIFEVPAGGQSTASRSPAPAGSPTRRSRSTRTSGILYLTEDNFGFPSGFYRYIPATNPMETGELDNDGQLQMLAVVGQPNLDLAVAQPKRATLPGRVGRHRRPGPDASRTRPAQTAPTTNDDALIYVGNQGRAKGAAYFSRLEGQVYDHGRRLLHLDPGRWPGRDRRPDRSPTATATAPARSGRIGPASQTLQLLYESPGADTLDFPDNVTASPRGTLILCEDNINDNYLRGLSRGGQLWDIALNRMVSQLNGANRFNDEFAGLDLQPGRRDAVRQHPGVARDLLRDLGAVGADRGLTAPDRSARLGVAESTAVRRVSSGMRST